jgi:diaminohydroxyphosphoribosylaminopyrimidine deaminase/5-amino-6-(5-phosphoribosylamino)uracil reductase
MSLDGRTAMGSGESLWITGEAARLDVQRLRARSSAIVTGIGTVLADDPSLTVRLPGVARQPLRVVLDPRLSMHECAKMLNDDGGPVLLVTAAEPDEAWERVQARGAEVLALPHGPDGVDLAALLDELATREVNEVLVETGATLAGAWLAAGLIDELVVYMAPKLMGDGARGLFRLPGIERMADALPLTISDVRPVGSDWRITARVA